MAWVLGETVSESFDIGTTGQTITRTASYINGSSSVWNPTFSEIGSGFYRYSYTPAVAGSFEWVGTATNGTPVSINFDVEATGVTVVVSSATSGALTQTLLELRRRVADRFDDYTPLVSTSNGNAGKTTLIDIQNVNAGEQHYNGANVVATSGSNSGLSRVVIGTDQTTGTLTLNLALTAATATNDTFDVYNRTGRKFKKAQYDRAINAAINDAFPMAVVAVKGTVATAFDAETPEITVPAAVTEVSVLEAQDSDGDWHQVPKARTRGGDGWFADPSEGTLRLHGRAAWEVDTLSLRVFGYGRQPALTSDSDTCVIDAEFIVSRAAYHLALGNVGQDDMAVRVNIFRDESERARVRIARLRDPWSQKVRST